jgi:hypothetical protein
MNQEHAFVLAAEKLLGIEVPRRGQATHAPADGSSNELPDRLYVM